MSATHIQLTRSLGPFDLQVSIASDARRIGVMGPSGSGKSTLMRILAGVDVHAKGLVRIDGAVLQDTVAKVFTPAWERRVGWLPQDSLVFPHLTVRQNLAYGSRDSDALPEVARDLEIEDLLERTAARLSGGEAQRVALGRALLSQPRRILLDEPFSALDDSLKSRVVRVIDGMLDDRPTVVVSHDRALLESLGVELWTMDRGLASRLE